MIQEACWNQQQTCQHVFIVCRNERGQLRERCRQCGLSAPDANWLKRVDHPSWERYPIYRERADRVACDCYLCRMDREIAQARRDSLDERLNRHASLRSRPDWTPERYAAYLQSESWSQIKSLVHRRDKTCRICNTGTDQLVVHHRTYKRLGEELLDDLTLLCRVCHDLYHRHIDD